MDKNIFADKREYPPRVVDDLTHSKQGKGGGRVLCFALGAQIPPSPLIFRSFLIIAPVGGSN